MIPKEKILSVKPEQISFDKEGLIVNGEKFLVKRPRLEFARALNYFLEGFNEHFRMFYRVPGTYIANNTVFGPEKLVMAWDRYIKLGMNCTIGDAGFGFEVDEQGQLIQIPHLGRVWIGERVVIRNSVCIDRAVLGETIIGDGTVIDNLVHIAHGVKIGKNCLIVAGTTIGGSSVIGDNCFLGINCSIKNKVKIGDNVTIGMGAIITKDIPDNVTVIGINKILEK